MQYKTYSLQEDLVINSLITFYYMELTSHNAPFGSEQIIKNYLEILLIQLIQKEKQRRIQSDLQLPLQAGRILN